MLIGYLAFMIFVAFVLALWEIQIEGKDGWAANSPGWRIEKGWLVTLAGGALSLRYPVTSNDNIFFEMGQGVWDTKY